ncbi:trimeric intracellular cation channel family protein [Acidianus sulfidivorans JP7]|uniref:Glycine transporter domain-containing protein n=1 Tax=Acidianus sulfidivorans JP7 TaxID=619593 RepID=A0A2U9IK67_9CREN|nr:trimeric intracellular cation channel family protein [Acidianus sulfidivorans]AWR96366.1 trimeric intracellular cation channel family protein [Acidianus sulfidivorans JP7]
MTIVLTITNYIGIIAFSISGAIKAIEKKMDLLGVITLGFSTSLAGGILADLLLGIHPPTNLVYLPYPIASFTASLITFLYFKKFNIISKMLIYADALGLGAFTASGSSLAYHLYTSPLLVIMIGTITAVGGGVLRDILANDIPLVLTKEFYATSAIIGSSVYYVLASIDVPDYTNSSIVLLLTFFLRVLAIIRKWKLPSVS